MDKSGRENWAEWRASPPWPALLPAQDAPSKVAKAGILKEALSCFASVPRSVTHCGPGSMAELQGLRQLDLWWSPKGRAINREPSPVRVMRRGPWFHLQVMNLS